VAQGGVPGVVTLLSRRGEVHVDAVGVKSLGGSDPMQRDTIFRIASMTKPITVVATMILAEECTVRLDEPVDGLLPELANRRVLKRLDGPLDDYRAFGEMLLNKGRRGTERILSRPSVETKTTHDMESQR
jgi:Beta-lactamase